MGFRAGSVRRPPRASRLVSRSPRPAAMQAAPSSAWATIPRAPIRAARVSASACRAAARSRRPAVPPTKPRSDRAFDTSSLSPSSRAVARAARAPGARRPDPPRRRGRAPGCAGPPPPAADVTEPLAGRGAPRAGSPRRRGGRRRRVPRARGSRARPTRPTRRRARRRISRLSSNSPRASSPRPSNWRTPPSVLTDAATAASSPSRRRIASPSRAWRSASRRLPVSSAIRASWLSVAARLPPSPQLEADRERLLEQPAAAAEIALPVGEHARPVERPGPVRRPVSAARPGRAASSQIRPSAGRATASTRRGRRPGGP